MKSFRRVIRDVCLQHKIRTIAEEMNLQALQEDKVSESVPYQVCSELGLLHQYSDPTLHERKVLGIRSDHDIKLQGWRESRPRKKIGSAIRMAVLPLIGFGKKSGCVESKSSMHGLFYSFAALIFSFLRSHSPRCWLDRDRITSGLGTEWGPTPINRFTGRRPIPRLVNNGVTMLKNMAFLWIVLISTNALAGSTPYKGRGGQIEAYGMIMGTYFAALAAIEICGENPAYERESEETARNYLNANHSLYIRLAKKLNELAIKNGGDKESLRLKSEIHDARASMEKQAKDEMRKQVVNKDSCTSILANIRKGVMDLKTQRGNEIARILE